MAEGSRGSVKGSVLLSRLAFLRKELGDPGVARVLARLANEQRAILEGLMLPHQWYPFEINVELDLAIACEMQQGEEIFRVLGAASATDNLSSPSQQQYVTGADPHALLKHTTAIYSVYYDTGYRRYEKVSRSKAILRTFSSLSFSPEDCLTVVGWHERAIEMCGGGDARVLESKCRTRGDSICEYICEWE